MVCDAGGGTVVSFSANPCKRRSLIGKQDIITYKVLSEFPLRLEEVLTPEGNTP